MRLRDEPQFLSLSNENNSLIHLLESFREVQKTRRKALGTHKNSVNGSYFLICLKPNLLFFTRNFQQRSKTLSHCRAKVSKESFLFPERGLPARGRRGWRSAQGCKGRRRQEAAESLVRGPGGPQPHPFSLGSARGRHPLPTGSARQGPAASSAEDAAVGVLKRGGGSRRGADGRRLRREKESSRSLPALPKLETADSRGTKPPAPR